MEGISLSLVSYNHSSSNYYYYYYHHISSSTTRAQTHNNNNKDLTVNRSNFQSCPKSCSIITTTKWPISYKNRNHHQQHLRVSSFATTSVVDSEKPDTKVVRHKDKEMPKIDKSGRFCSPRAARELSLLTIYGACLEGSDPLRLFEKRLNGRREPGYEFDKNTLLEYNHMSFGGPPVSADTLEEADELLRSDERESSIEAQVLSAPPKLVYSKLLLRFARKHLVAVVDRWDAHALVIDKVAPPNWKNEPAGRILEFCILHLAMSEISVLGTRHQIVINEAVDLAKRFCDGAAPRVINGCLRTFVKDHLVRGTPEDSVADEKVEV